MTPLALAGELFALPFARDLRLIGGLGVRVLAGSIARSTLDVDLVAATKGAAAAFRTQLEGTGWRVGDAGASRRWSGASTARGISSRLLTTSRF